MYVWLIPGNKVNTLTSATISKSTIHKWDKYSLDISKVIDGCDAERTTDNREVNTQYLHDNTNTSELQLSIITAIESGVALSSLRRKLAMKESAFQYHLTILKSQGIIRRVGYGTWEVLDQPDSAKKRTTVPSYVGPINTQQPRSTAREITQSQLTQFQQDAVRAHAFVFTLQVPKSLRNWNNKKRTQYLSAHEIPFKQLNIGGGGQRIIVKDRKVWLTNKSIIIYDKASYFAEDALQAKGTAIATHISIIKHIERLLHVEFRIGDDYKFKVSRQHYALIYNALAKQYNEAGEKLEVRNGRGLWFLIDNSFNMNEAETMGDTAMSDNQKVQGYFNGLKDIPASQGAPTYTPAFVLEVMNGIQQNQMAFAENMASHIDAVKSLGSGVKDMTAAIKRLNK
jgi:hypothetical protein